MKKAIVIFFLSVLIMPFYATYFYLHYEKAIIRRTVKHRIIRETPKDKLEHLVFSVKQTQSILKWEHSREFEYNGRMYDVVFKEIKNDSIHYWCWEDHKETAVNQKFKELFANAVQHDPVRQEKHKKLMDFMNSLFYSNCQWKINLFNEKQTVKSFYTKHYLSVELKPDVPPPKSRLV